MIAVVLARGAGRRMQEPVEGVPLTAAQAAAAERGGKAMMPVGHDDRPLLDYIVASLRAAGCDRVCIVVAPDHHDMRRRYADRPPKGVAIEFAVQPIAAGTADAVLCARGVVGDEPFLVMNADNLYPHAMLRGLTAADGPAVPVFTKADLVASSNIPAERVAQFALLDVDASGWLRGVIEKPSAETMNAAGPDAAVSMNAWRFDARIFDACRDVPVSPRGERELPVAVALAVQRGVRFRAFRAHGPVLDLSRRSDIAEVSRRLAGIEIDW